MKRSEIMKDIAMAFQKQTGALICTQNSMTRLINFLERNVRKLTEEIDGLNSTNVRMAARIRLLENSILSAGGALP